MATLSGAGEDSQDNCIDREGCSHIIESLVWRRQQRLIQCTDLSKFRGKAEMHEGSGLKIFE